MRKGLRERLAAGAICAPILLACGTSSVEADPEKPTKWLYFSGADLWRSGASFHGGLRWSPHGTEREGFTLKALLAAGTYRYLAGGQPIRGTYTLGALMPGWHFVRGKFIATAYAGPDLQSHRFVPDDPGNAMRGTHIGLRTGADFWWEPDTRTMLAASLSYSTIGRGHWLRGAAGWRIADKAWLGPEAILSGDRSYQQFAVGLHLTGLKFSNFEWTFAGGITHDDAAETGAYGRISLLARR